MHSDNGIDGVLFHRASEHTGQYASRAVVAGRLNWEQHGMKTSPPWTIGAVATASGCSVATIRYYEQIGLLPGGPRSDSGRRMYSEGALQRLRFIRRCREFGFGLEQVRLLVALMDQPERSCTELRDVAAAHLLHVRRKLGDLVQLERSMTAFVQSCDTACDRGQAVDCTVLDRLSGPTEEEVSL